MKTGATEKTTAHLCKALKIYKCHDQADRAGFGMLGNACEVSLQCDCRRFGTMKAALPGSSGFL